MHPDPDGARRRSQRAKRSAPRRPRRRPRRPWWRWAFALPLLLAALSALPVVALRWIDPPVTAFMLAAQLEAARAGRQDFTLRYEWVPLGAISPWASVAVIAAEDQKFPQHRGFDFDALGEALEHNRRGGRLRGASTITQQLAKNLYLWSGRHWMRKGLEAWFTVLLETFLPKARILELYLNVAELGPGLYGVGAASAHYFGHAPAALSAEEAALLAAVLPNPRRYRVDAPSAYTRARQQWILRHMRQLGGPALIARLRH
jgi:monofunctional biosynthetic peptidoglycan transglycosylase